MFKTTLSILGTTLALGGIATGCATSEEDRVKDAVHAWHNDLADGRGPQACARLSDAGREDFLAGALRAGDCELLVADLASELTPTQKEFLPRIEIRRVEFRGDRAFIHSRDVALPDELAAVAARDDEPTVLRKLDGRWLIEDMG